MTSTRREPAPEVVLAPDDHVLGNPSAPVTVVEFGDYECPFCAAAAPVLRRLVEESDGQVRLVFRNFPLADRHPHRPGDDLFVGSVIIGQVNVGTWRRTVRGRSVLIETALAPGLGPQARDQAADAAAELARFLGKPLELTVVTGGSN